MAQIGTTQIGTEQVSTTKVSMTQVGTFASLCLGEPEGVLPEYFVQVVKIH
jgi:hypothetical protein